MVNPYEAPQIQDPATSADITRRQGLVGIFVSLTGLLLAGIYLANPGWGFVELLPDNVPGIGNIDEFVASAIFLTCLSRLGVNVLPPRLPSRALPKD